MLLVRQDCCGKKQSSARSLDTFYAVLMVACIDTCTHTSRVPPLMPCAALVVTPAGRVRTHTLYKTPSRTGAERTMKKVEQRTSFGQINGSLDDNTPATNRNATGYNSSSGGTLRRVGPPCRVGLVRDPGGCWLGSIGLEFSEHSRPNHAPKHHITEPREGGSLKQEG